MAVRYCIGCNHNLNEEQGVQAVPEQGHRAGELTAPEDLQAEDNTKSQQNEPGNGSLLEVLPKALPEGAEGIQLVLSPQNLQHGVIQSRKGGTRRDNGNAEQNEQDICGNQNAAAGHQLTEDAVIVQNALNPLHGSASSKR